MLNSRVKSLLLILVFCLTQVSLLALTSTPAQAQTSGPNLDYTVTIQKGQPSVHVKLEVTGITTTQLTLRFKEEAWYVENYVHNLSASSDGSALKVVDTGRGTWMISPSGSSATLEYDIDKVVPFGYYAPDSSTISVYFNDEGGVIMPAYFFIYPDVTDVNSITIKFNLPAEWQVIAPYPEEGDRFTVQRITNSLLTDFLNRQGISIGKMKYYAERQVDGCTVKFGILDADQGTEAASFHSQEDLEDALDIATKCLENLVGLFNANPYKVFVIYTMFRPSPAGPIYPNDRYMGNTCGYWGEHRFDELIGHMIYAFIVFDVQIGRSAPVLASEEIMKGFGEQYYGPKLAWKMFNDTAYLGKLYYYYLIYERFCQSERTGDWEFPVYLKAPFVALMLDAEIQNLTGGTKSLDDVLRFLYSTYENTGKVVNYVDVQHAAETVTGKSFQNLFSRYVYGNEKIPYQYIQDYKPYFLDYPERFVEAFRPAAEGVFYGSTIPFFINIELMVHREEHVPMGAFIYASDRIKNFASYMLSHYTIDNLTEKDVEDALTALAGADCSGFFTRWENSYGRLSLGELKEWLRSYSGRGTGFQSPPSFSVKNLSISPKTVEAGKPVKISVDVTNIGGTEGTFSVELSINGKVIDTKDVTLAPGEIRTVSFVVSEDEEGTYQVSINGLSGSFEVTKPAPPVQPEETPLILVIVGVIVAVIIGGILLYRRR